MFIVTNDAAETIFKSPTTFSSGNDKVTNELADVIVNTEWQDNKFVIENVVNKGAFKVTPLAARSIESAVKLVRFAELKIIPEVDTAKLPRFITEGPSIVAGLNDP